MAYIPSSSEEEQYLKDYNPLQYRNPGVAADTALFALDGDAIKLLLIKRGNYPYKDKWAVPGGFVNLDEDIIDSASRELFEEAGVEGLYLEQAFVWGRPDRDPRDRVITVSYISFADFSKIKPKAGDDAARAEWFAIKDYRSDKDGFTYVDYTLEGPETLKPSVKFPSGQIQQISCVNSGGLAFDHPESVVYSFELLKQRVKDGRFLEFALEDETLRERARMAILSA
jgi:ADP-ribose pyrophosphatase YjhB (NUDIX family)